MNPILMTGVFLICILYPCVLSQEYDILVLGAGFSGLGAAIQLGRNSVENFLVLEAKDYIGGRVKSAFFGGVQVELGAGWVHDTEFERHEYYHLSKKYNMKLHPENYANVLYKWKNGTEVDETLKSETENELSRKYLKIKDIASKRYEEGRGGVNSRTAMKMADWIPDTYMKQAVEYYKLDFENGVTPEDIDAIATVSLGSAILRSSWSTDPHVMGSYSTQTGGINEDDYLALDHPINASLWFVGEYRGRDEFGYAHKAFELGIDEAERILKCIREYLCPQTRPTRKMYCSLKNV